MKLEQNEELPTIRMKVKNIDEVVTYVNFVVNILGQAGILGTRQQFVKDFVFFREQGGTPTGFLDITDYEAQR